MSNNITTNNNQIPMVTSPLQTVYPHQQGANCSYIQNCPVPTVPIPAANGVNIVVYNPQVTPNANVSNVNNYPQQAYPQNYYTMPQPTVEPKRETIAATSLEVKTKSDVKEEKKQPTPQKTKEVVLLTDEYIKTLETYLDSQDPKVRTLGVKELLNRFQEDESRKSDVGLTALLNKALQDPNDSIRFVAMTILHSGYAKGDDLTQQLLSKLQAGQSAYGDDSLYSSEIKLKTAGEKIQIPDTSKDEKKEEVKTK